MLKAVWRFSAIETSRPGIGVARIGVVGIAIFHVGVEQGWWQGTAACTGASTAGMTTEELTQAIMNAPVTRCDEPAFVFLGISMAGYDAIYAALLLAAPATPPLVALVVASAAATLLSYLGYSRFVFDR